jgi:hypothetical protein
MEDGSTSLFKTIGSFPSNSAPFAGSLRNAGTFSGLLDIAIPGNRHFTDCIHAQPATREGLPHLQISAL